MFRARGALLALILLAVLVALVLGDVALWLFLHQLLARPGW